MNWSLWYLYLLRLMWGLKDRRLEKDRLLIASWYSGLF